MPIFDQGYQHWQGGISGHGLRWLAITRQGVSQQLRRRRLKWLISLAFAPALALATILILWGLVEQKSSLLDPLMFLLQSLPEEVRAGPKAYRTSVWTMAFHIFFGIETFFSMILILSVGPDLVSQDLRFNAMPLYFSRPLRRIDYFLGKLGVIGVFLGAVSIGPAVAAYVLGVAFSLDFGVVKDTWRLLVGSVAFGLVLVVSGGTLMLAISSATRNSRLVGAFWIGLWVVGNVTSGALNDTVDRDWCPLVSYTSNLDRVRESLLNTPAAREQFLALWRAGRDVTPDDFKPRFLRRSRRRSSEEMPMYDDRPALLRAPENVRQPLSWSVGVLGGLFALSALTLSTRVKSMDRLKS